MPRGGYLARALDGTDRSIEAHDILSGLAMLALCLFQAFALWRGQAFDVSSFGMSICGILAGGAGVAVGQGFLLGRTPRARATTPDNPDGGR
jgi:hypothetical protein